MKTKFTLLISALSLGLSVSAQLAAGDLAFIGYNTDSGPGTNDNFTFITLNEIPGSEIIYFGEEGWNNITDSWAGTTEGHIIYTAPAAGLPCGTIININEISTNTFAVIGGGTAILGSGSSWSLSGGDQVLAYQGPSAEPASPTFIAGVHGDDGNGAPLTLDPITFWNTAALTPLGTARSEEPAGLTSGENCVALFNIIGTEEDNAIYAGTLTGTAAFLRGEINDRNNWFTNNATAYNITPAAFSPDVTCPPPCNDPTIPTITYAPATLCEGETATLTISGTLNDATTWHIYTGSCGGTEIGTTAGTSFDVTPGAPSTTYFIRGEGGCVVPESCGTVTVNITPEDDATFNYDAALYCPNGADPSPTIATGGGTFSFSPGGLSINTSTGEVDLSETTSGTYTITYTTAGACPSDAEQTITVEDTEAPVPTLATLPDITAECEVATLTNPGVTDNCTGDVTITHDATLPITGEGTTLVTWTYDDGNGNTSTQTQNIVIDDITAPTPDLASLTAITAECEVASLTPPTATDNCGGTVTITHDATLPITGEGTTVITWTYDDGNGNTSTQTQNVVIDDTTPPSGAVDPLPDFSAACAITELPNPEVTDNCDGTITITNDAVFPIIASTTITWTYDDGNGNTAEQTQGIVFEPIDVTTNLDGSGTVITANNTDADSYQWVHCAEEYTAIDGANTAEYTATENGEYAVIIVEGECADTSECVTISAVGIEIYSSNQIQLYPNPVSQDFIFIKSDMAVEKIWLVDLNGRLLESQFNRSEGQVTLKEIESGNYVVNILLENGTLTQKSIIITQ